MQHNVHVLYSIIGIYIVATCTIVARLYAPYMRVLHNNHYVNYVVYIEVRWGDMGNMVICVSMSVIIR